MYRFDITDSNGEIVKVSPIYGEGAKITITRESEERYCRYDVDGDFTFVGRDYDLFYERAGESFVFNVYGGEDGSVKIMSAPFTTEDLEYDADNRIATLKLKGKDQYEELLEQMNAEYDLVQMAPEKNSVVLYKRAFLQIFVKGDTRLTNIVGGFEYEVDATNNSDTVTHSDLEKMGFTQFEDKEKVGIDIPGGGPAAARYSGVYIRGKWDIHDALWPEDSTKNVVWIRSTGNTREFVLYSVSGFPSYPDAGAKIYFFTDNYYDIKTKIYIDYGEYQRYQIGNVGRGKYDIYGRIIADRGTESQRIDVSTDIWKNTLNYRYRISFSDAGMFSDIATKVVVSDATTNVPNQWMRDDYGEYFVQPEPESPKERVIAIGWNQWIPYSYWLRNSVQLTVALKKYDDRWILKDAYRLSDAIKKMLEKIAPNIGYCSDFIDNSINAVNPITNQYLGLYITPITNIKRTYYDHAAQRGKITLKQILDMLKKCFNCYWYLEWSGGKWVMRIEHVDWFDRGGQYAIEGLPPVSPIKDFTKENLYLAGLPWITNQQKFRYDLSEIKSRVSYEWGDKSAEIFNGYPISATVGFAKDKPVVKEQIANFMADIDIIESSPESLSDDVYVLIGADYDDEVYREEVGYAPNMGGYPSYIMQNSGVSFLYTEQKFLNYDMPVAGGKECVLDGLKDKEGNNLPVFSQSEKKVITQSISVPMEIEKPDLCYDFIRTGLMVAGGKDGAIKKISANLTTQSAEIELLFNDKHIKK